jgi:PAS domain S-box-containing protein
MNKAAVGERRLASDRTASAADTQCQPRSCLSGPCLPALNVAGQALRVLLLVAWAESVPPASCAPAIPPPPKPISIRAALRDANEDHLRDKLNETLVLSGVLTSDPTLTDRAGCVVTLQDRTGGIYLASQKPAQWIGLFRRGHAVVVRGRLESSRGRVQLQVTDLWRLGTSPLPNPREVLTTDLRTDQYAGQLVRVVGEIVLPPGFLVTHHAVLLRDRAGAIPVGIPARLLDDAKFSERLRQGGNVELAGIAGLLQDAQTTGLSYGLMPRDAADFVFARVPPYGAIALTTASMVFFGLTCFLWFRRRRAEERAQQMMTLSESLKRSEEALRASEARLRLVMLQLPAILWTTDRDLRFTSFSGAGLVALKLKPDQVVGLPLQKYFYFSTAEETHPALAAHRRAIAGESVTYEVQLGERLYECHVEPLYDAQCQCAGAIGLALDITERKRAAEALQQSEAQLRQSQKMEAVGRLAGGVAHDFNNLLMVIRGYCDLMAREAGKGSPLSESIEEIRKSATRATSLTSQLLAFSRKQVMQLRVLDLNEVVTNMHKLLRRLIGEHIHLVTNLEPELGFVKVDRGQIEQVIMNLGVNAHDAMPNGGKLIIETANADLPDEEAARQIDVRPGQYVMLSVSDSGLGMDAEVQSHLFEPFFTTKEPGRGTGLGLSTVYGIVSQSGGNIRVASGPGLGTTFRIYLPKVQEEEVEATKARASRRRLRHGSETILLVEDEEAVRILVKKTLELHGYTVLDAGNGTEALKLSQTCEGPIHLALTDVIMPEMGGQELATRLSATRPELKVLYMSGYADQTIQQEILGPNVAFLEKPATEETLIRQVRELLDRPATRSPGEPEPGLSPPTAEPRTVRPRTDDQLRLFRDPPAP